MPPQPASHVAFYVSSLDFLFALNKIFVGRLQFRFQWLFLLCWPYRWPSLKAKLFVSAKSRGGRVVLP